MHGNTPKGSKKLQKARNAPWPPNLHKVCGVPIFQKTSKRIAPIGSRKSIHFNHSISQILRENNFGFHLFRPGKKVDFTSTSSLKIALPISVGRFHFQPHPKKSISLQTLNRKIEISLVNFTSVPPTQSTQRLQPHPTPTPYSQARLSLRLDQKNSLRRGVLERCVLRRKCQILILTGKTTVIWCNRSANPSKFKSPHLRRAVKRWWQTNRHPWIFRGRPCCGKDFVGKGPRFRKVTARKPIPVFYERQTL
jgi:hypothetical protein